MEESPQKTAAEAIDWLQALGIQTSPTRLLIGDAFTLAVTFSRTVYDALYLALAIASGRPLLTADERLANAVGARVTLRTAKGIQMREGLRLILNESDPGFVLGPNL